MSLTLTGCFVTFIVVLITVLVKRRKDELRFFEKLGIPGPCPHFLWGHYDKFQTNHIYWLEKWAKEYGDFYGIFLGSKPLLVSTDVEFAKFVLIKEFSNFSERVPIFSLERSDPNVHKFLSLVDGEEWKKQRSVITPAFTTKNMKEMLPLILKGADDFIACLRKQKDRFNIAPLARCLAIDNLGRTVFGIDVGAQSAGHTSGVYETITKVAELSMTGTLDLMANSFSSFGLGFAGGLRYLSEFGIIGRTTDDLGQLIREIIQSKKTTQKSNNLLLRMMDAAEPDGTTTSGPALSFDENELVSNSVGLFFVGVDTTSIFLSYFFYCLGQNQDAQDRLREEIIQGVGEDFDYYEVSNLKYLDNVINEVLRLYPPATGFNTRRATRQFTFGERTFPAGTNILFAVSSIQRDERHWEDPLEFRPERFEARSNNQLAFQPFGDGPRNCVGMRLASMSVKFIIAKVVPKFRIRSHGEVGRRSVSVLSVPGEVIVSLEPL